LGARDVLLVQAPITLLASAAGVWLFYVQHQFEHTYWAWDTDWSLHTSALYGSSHYDLPPVLRWFTAKIGIHHVDHLCSRIPYYRLGEVLRAHPELRAVSRLTLMESVRCLRLACGTGTSADWLGGIDVVVARRKHEAKRHIRLKSPSKLLRALMQISAAARGLR
jgi:hypothetical protein